MVGQRPLKPLIGVRIPAPQQCAQTRRFRPAMEWFSGLYIQFFGGQQKVRCNSSHNKPLCLVVAGGEPIRASIAE